MGLFCDCDKEILERIARALEKIASNTTPEPSKLEVNFGPNIGPETQKEQNK